MTIDIAIQIIGCVTSNTGFHRYVTHRISWSTRWRSGRAGTRGSTAVWPHTGSSRVGPGSLMGRRHPFFSRKSHHMVL